MPSLRRRTPAAPANAAVKRSHSPASARVRPATDEAPTANGVGGTISRLRLVWSTTRQRDPRMPLFVLGPALLTLAVLVVVGVLIGHIVTFSVLGVLAAVMVGMAIFGRRATAQVYSQVEGQVGAAAQLLTGMRGDWRVTPAVAFNRNQDLVHRVAGRAGVVFVAEGPSIAQQRQLVVDQKRRVARVAPDVALHEIYVGDGEGQVPLRKVQNTVMRLPRTMRPKEVAELEHRLKAIGGTGVPLPKGPMPRNVRMPRGGGPRVR